MNALIEHLRTRGLRDRSSRSAWTYVSVGIAIGVCLASPMAVSAQGFQEWTKPPVLMSMVGLIVSVGMAWQMVQEDRRRIALLETDSVKKENLAEVLKRVDEVFKRIDGSLNLLLDGKVVK